MSAQPSNPDLDFAVREAFCRIGHRIWQKGYVASNDGNFSFRLEENLVVCTPTMFSKGFMQPSDMVYVDLDGNQVGGSRRMTSEVRMHLFLYRARPDVHCVVHAHPPHATTFAIARHPLPRCVMAEAEVNLGLVPLAPYATTGTWEFARTIEPWVRNHDVFLLASHGAVVAGSDPFDAYYRLETLDQYARILLLARGLGGWEDLDPASVAELLQLKQRLRIADPRLQEGAPSCGLAVPPTPAHRDAPPARFRPHPGPITDMPKFSPLPINDTPVPGARPDLEAAAWEVFRRL